MKQKRMMKKMMSMLMIMIMLFGSFTPDVGATSRKVVSSLSVSEDKAGIYVGQTKKISYFVKASAKAAKKVVVKSSNKKVVSVKLSGAYLLITGKKVGSTTVTITTRYKNKSGSKLSKKIHISVNNVKKYDDQTETSAESVEQSNEVLKPVVEEVADIVPEISTEVATEATTEAAMEEATTEATTEVAMEETTVEVATEIAVEETTVAETTEVAIEETTTESATEAVKEKTSTEVVAPSSCEEKKEVIPSISYQAHIETSGWLSEVKDGATAGNVTINKQLEGIKINLKDESGKSAIKYQAHVQGPGWQEVKSSGELSGTTGQSKRLEAIQIKLKGEYAKHFDIYYKMHVEGYGWLGWAKNSETAGTTQSAWRAEAIDIRLVAKDTPVDRGGVASYSNLTKAPATKSKTLNVNWNEIAKVGNQPSGSDACGCYAVAYARTVLDGYAHSWSEYNYNRNGNPYDSCAAWSWGGFGSANASETDIYKLAVETIDSGKPMIIRVAGNGSRKTRGHYVTVVGYENVKDGVSAANLLIIDPWPGSTTGGVENLGNLGYYALGQYIR